MGHDLQSSSSSDTDGEDVTADTHDNVREDIAADTHSEPEHCASLSAPEPVPPSSSPPDACSLSALPSPSPPDSPPGLANQPQDPWFPFLSKPHMQLCLMYDGSHRYGSL